VNLCVSRVSVIQIKIVVHRSGAGPRVRRGPTQQCWQFRWQVEPPDEVSRA
jgi:hypothetical protein